MEENYFYEMVRTLRREEEVILYRNILTITDSEEESVMNFLQKEYVNESLNFPFNAPPYNPEAALWGARAVYFGAQLILYRQNGESELPTLFPELRCELTPSAILSVDLCFRFIPELLHQLKLIDSEDPLISILENHLHKWHYSGISYPLPLDTMNFTAIFQDQCLQQLYLDRIVECKCLLFAKRKQFYKLLRGNFGLYQNDFWEEFNLITIDE